MPSRKALWIALAGGATCGGAFAAAGRQEGVLESLTVFVIGAILSGLVLVKLVPFIPSRRQPHVGGSMIRPFDRVRRRLFPIVILAFGISGAALLYIDLPNGLFQGLLVVLGALILWTY